MSQANVTSRFVQAYGTRHVALFGKLYVWQREGGVLSLRPDVESRILFPHMAEGAWRQHTGE